MRNMKTLRAQCLGTAGIVAITLAATPRLVWAGAASPPTVAEVIVTATRRQEKLQDVPASVSAVTEERLELIGARGKTDYVLSVPGVSFTDRGGGREDFTIRGIANLGSGATTAIYVDEIPIPQGLSFSYDLRLFDIDRVEVLRGPQGTLFGASSMGGAIRTLTHKPTADAFGGRYDAAVSKTFEGGVNYDVNLAVNAPISTTLAGRVVAFKERRSGFIDNYRLIDNGAGGFTPGAKIKDNPDSRDVIGARSALRWTPTEALAVTGTYYFQDSKFNGINSEDIDPFGEHSLKQGRALQERHSHRINLGNITVDYDLGWAKLLSSTSYSRATGYETLDFTRAFGPTIQFFNDTFGDGSSTAGVTPLSIAQDSTETAFTQEVRLTSNAEGRLRWVAGAFYNHVKDRAVQIFYGKGGSAFFGGLVTNDSLFDYRISQPKTEVSVFGELNYKVTDKLEATLGVRRYDARNDFDFTQKGLFNFAGSLTDITVGSRNIAKAREEGFTYKALLSYKPRPGFMVFVGASSGYRPGAPNQALPAGQTPTPTSQYDSDKLWQYELGLKTEAFDRRLIVNASAYYIDWSDIQTSVGTDGGFSFIANVGKAHVSGLEIEAQAAPISGLNLTAALTLQDTSIDSDFVSLDVNKGDPIPNIPDVSGNVSIGYRWPELAGWAPYVFAQATYVSDRITNANQKLKLAAYGDGSLRIGGRRGRLDASLFIDNITDTRGVIGRETGNTGTERINYIQPRTLGFSLKSDF